MHSHKLNAYIDICILAQGEEIALGNRVRDRKWLYILLKKVKTCHHDIGEGGTNLTCNQLGLDFVGYMTDMALIDKN